MQTVLVTGGAGFIGSHLVEEYLKRGYKVVVVDNLSTGKMENLNNVMENELFFFYEANICNIDELEQIMDKHRPDIIDHHDARKSIPYSVEDPVFDIKTNGIGLLNLIMLSNKFSVEKIIYASSGGALSKDITGCEKSRECDTPQLKSPYGITKFAGENYLKLY